MRYFIFTRKQLVDVVLAVRVALFLSMVYDRNQVGHYVDISNTFQLNQKQV